MIEIEKRSIFVLLVLGIAIILILSLPNEIPSSGDDIIQKHYCSANQRAAEFCTEIYQPVCGWYGFDINCFREPCAVTFSNMCFACRDYNVIYYTMGECPS